MDALSSALGLEERLVNQATERKLPLGGSLELLPLCNMNCDMCYVRLDRKEMEAKGRLRTVREWVRLAEEMYQNGVLFLLLTGGEPFLYPGFRELYLELGKLGMIVTINTNGTLVDESLADFLSEHKPRRVNVTLYGKDSATYKRLCHYEDGFEQAIRGIRLLQERGVDVKLNGSLTQANRKDIDALLQIADELKAPIRIDSYMYPAVRERDRGFNESSRVSPEEAAEVKLRVSRHNFPEEKFQAYRQFMRDNRNAPVLEDPDCSVKCRAGRSSFVINWQGNMTPCIMLSSPGINVFESGFMDAWKYIVRETGKIRVSSACAACPKREICPTCAACSLLETGSYEGVPEYMCQYTEALLQKVEKF